jgi:enamine deaminase RidA (YjgF/YER057c/UK114 family)
MSDVMKLWAALWIGVLLCGGLEAQRKKDVEPKTQVLELPPDLPNVVTVPAANVRFLNAPLTGKGLMSSQIRESLRWIQKNARGASIVRLRAFVAGTGDLRRVASVISEEMTERRQALPVLTTVQVGALPEAGAQLLMEATLQDRRVLNPEGLAFFSGQQVEGGRPEELVTESIKRLQQAFAAARVEARSVLQVTCYASSVESPASMWKAMQDAAPEAAVSLVQLSRASTKGIAECEATGRLASRPALSLEMVNPAGMTKSPMYSQMALVGPGPLVMTGGRVGFRTGEADVQQVFQRLERDFEGSGAGWAQVAMTRYYPLYTGAAEAIRKVRFQFLKQDQPPASTLLVFEGLPGMDSSWGVDLVLVK